MYVCICNAITDRAVSVAIDDGAHSVAQVYKRIGAAPQCGKCKDMIRAMIDDRHALQTPLEAVADFGMPAEPAAA